MDEERKMRGDGPSAALHGFAPPVFKSSGQEFKFWRNETPFAKTYHVDIGSLKASDDNPGTEEHPFRTIGRAADILQPGERVLVHPGIYRECIRPPRGGRSPSQMIGYHAVSGGQVIVKGSEPVGRRWVTQNATADLRSIDLQRVIERGNNPFALSNLPDAGFDLMDWATKLRGSLPFTLPRGMVFQEGRRLLRVASHEELMRTAGSHWTDVQSGTLFVHTFDQQEPNEVLMEITTRSACFRPKERGLGYIHIQGFTFEQVGNGFPRPQEGAISVCGGHHWLIEENTLRQVNGIGIDIGNGWYGGSILPPEPGESRAEWNIVRRNHVSETGICGIAGVPATHALIEENILRNNTLYPAGGIAECAAIKTHINHGTLIRRNRIGNDHAVVIAPDKSTRTIGIWMDFDNRDSRCTQNVIVNCTWGIYLEASAIEPWCLVDRNIIWGARYGIYEADSQNQTFAHNLVGRSEVGIVLRGKVSDRMVGDGCPTAGGGHRIANNLLFEVKKAVEDANRQNFPPSLLENNAMPDDAFQVTLDADALTLTITALKPATDFCRQLLVTHDLFDRPWPSDIRSPGPLPIPDTNKLSCRLD